MSILQDASRFDVIRLRNDPLNLGKSVSFAALSPFLNFPSKENVRSDLQKGLRQDDALSLLETSKIKKAIDKVVKRIY